MLKIGIFCYLLVINLENKKILFPQQRLPELAAIADRVDMSKPTPLHSDSSSSGSSSSSSSDDSSASSGSDSDNEVARKKR